MVGLSERVRLTAEGDSKGKGGPLRSFDDGAKGRGKTLRTLIGIDKIDS